MAIRSINPYTNTIIKEYKEFSSQRIESSIQIAANAFVSWKGVSLIEKGKLLKKCALLLRERKEEYAKIMSAEMGKTKKEGMSEIEKCAECCDFYAEHAGEYLKDEKLHVADGQAVIVYQPLGVILAVMPWNFPFWQVFRFAAPNLMAGNVALLKHASNVPDCSTAIEEVIKDAGFPHGVFQSLLVSSLKVNKLIDDDRIAAVTLTGSEGAGSKVAERAGKNIKKTVLELGGSDPFIVLDDADPEDAASWAVKSRMINCGQSCIAAKRFIISEKVYDDFLDKLKSKFEALKIGDPLEDGIDYGPLATEELAENLMEQIKASVRAGARIVTGGRRPPLDGAFVSPTILTEIKPGMPAFEEELFGPVAIVFKAKDDDEAIELANSSRYGLGGSVWTKDTERGERLARQVESGAVYVNKMMASHPALPFGGVKKSGYGRELAAFGIREFMNVKTIWKA